MSLKKKPIAFLAGLILSAVVFWDIIQHDTLELICKVTLMDLAVAILIAFLTFNVSSLRLDYFVKYNTGKKLSGFDIATMSIASNLWGFLIPVSDCGGNL